ncbi:MAG: type II secretion system F family protein [Alphaproteobacteria bacterium]
MMDRLQALGVLDWQAAAMMASAMATVCLLIFVVSSATNRARKRRERRLARAALPSTARRIQQNVGSLRRKNDAGAMETAIGKLVPRPQELQKRLAQTGYPLRIGHYAMAVAAIAVANGFSVWATLGMPVGVAVLLGIASGVAVPQMLVTKMIKRRQAKFTKEFPEGIDVIVRGLRAGLPVSESIVNVGRELTGPVRDIFAAIAERLNFGDPVEQAVSEVTCMMDTPELKFFGISLSIQRETGGNLAETLSNLADILRRRRQMKLKIKALSSEARASAYILGSLPFVMFGLLYMVNNKYVMQLFEDPRGVVMVSVGLVMIFCGAFVMARMVNFEI